MKGPNWKIDYLALCSYFLNGKMNTFKYIWLYLQIQHCYGIINYLKQSLDIFDWCIVFRNHNEMISNEKFLTSRDFEEYWSFMTPDNFDCLMDHNTLILSYGLEWNDTKIILDHMSQSQLANNYLVVQTQDSNFKYLFEKYERPLTIRATILIFEAMSSGFMVHQILGTATKVQQLKELGNSNHINLRSVIQETRKNRNHHGIEIKANFGHFPPFCIVDKSHKVNGTFHDLFQTISEVVNLTLQLQNPLKGNENWGAM